MHNIKIILYMTVLVSNFIYFYITCTVIYRMQLKGEFILNKGKLVRCFISYYKPHWKLFVLDMACALLIALIDLYFPMLTREIIGATIPAGQMRTFWIF